MANNNNTPLSPITPLRRPWCQSVLPQVYDDALSYYEVLCGMGVKINEVITAQNNLKTAWEEYQTKLNNAWETFQSTINVKISDLQTAWSTYQTTLNQAWQTFQNVVNGQIAALTEEWSDYKNTLNTEWTTFQSTINNILDRYDTKWQDITSTWEGIETDWTSIQKDFADMQTAWENYQTTINNKIAELTSELSGMAIDVVYVGGNLPQLKGDPSVFDNADTIIAYCSNGDIFIGQKEATISTSGALAWRQTASTATPTAVFTLISEPTTSGLDLGYAPIQPTALDDIPAGTKIRANMAIVIDCSDLKQPYDMHGLTFIGGADSQPPIQLNNNGAHKYGITNFTAIDCGIYYYGPNVVYISDCTIDGWGMLTYDDLHINGAVNIKNTDHIIDLNCYAGDNLYNVSIDNSKVAISTQEQDSVHTIIANNSELVYPSGMYAVISYIANNCVIRNDPVRFTREVVNIDNCTFYGTQIDTINNTVNVTITNTTFIPFDNVDLIRFNSLPDRLTLFGNTVQDGRVKRPASYSPYEINKTGNVVNPLNQALIVGSDLNLDNIITPGVYGVETQNFYGTMLVTSGGTNTIMQILFTLGANTGAKFRSYNTASQTFAPWYTLNGSFGS